MNRRWQRVLVLGGVVMGLAIVALLAVIVYVLLSGDDGTGIEVARVTPTAVGSPTARPTLRATPSPTAPPSTPQPGLGQPTPAVTTAPGQATPPPAAQQPTSSPAPSAPTPQPATPPPAAACPGPPVLSSFTANPSTVTAGEWTTLSWGAVTNATSVVIDQGIGSVQAPGSVVVAVAATVTLTMTATGCGGTTTQQVTVIVNPATPAPTPSPTPPPPSPTPTEQPPPTVVGGWHIFTADLEVTMVWPDITGTVHIWGTNIGPDSLTNASVSFDCWWERTWVGPCPVGGTCPPPESFASSGVGLYTLGPGQKYAMATGIRTEEWYKYSVTCSISSPADSNPGNNSGTANIP